VPYTAYKKPNERTLITHSSGNLLQKDLLCLLRAPLTWEGKETHSTERNSVYISRRAVFEQVSAGFKKSE